ncbi:nitroreductase family protein [Paucibacter sp. PLA-PC-4]|uniref:nitroreductase family protein n=1 Tax=Paucibacter sp. PLA-PC-4 TaxID=2993655 RepID=UPI00224ABBF7|nr:nitroreductase family protein [Paucibacter sp. PLA-PC-4]MCX2864470.1 nitroreductase family protein [Paucibacter sp. PLA-PC-4]
MPTRDQVLQILDLARWAPSGDNTQPWRFEIIAPEHVVVHGFDTREHCVYDLDGHPSQISLGALLETAAIAASAHGLGLEISRRNELPESTPTFDVHLHADPSVRPDPLIDQIERRSVQRRPLSTRALSAAEKQQLQDCLPAGYKVHWLEGFTNRLQTALLMFRSARLRLTTPEAYRVHCDIIEWDCQFSATKVPDQALGVDAATTRLMRFVMKSWGRVQFFNRFLAGTWAPRLQMDFAPSLACAAHFVLYAPSQPKTVDDYVHAGRAMQRFWLKATELQLQLQPEVTPLVFARYAREQRPFSTIGNAMAAAADVKARLELLIGAELARTAVYMGRVGAGPNPSSRSLRRPLEDLIINRPAGASS